LVKIQQEDIEGWGEASPFSVGEKPQTTATIQQALQQVIPALEKFNPLERQQIEQVLTELQIPSAALAAIDIALHDWVGKKNRVAFMATLGIRTRSHCSELSYYWYQYPRSC